MRGRAHRSLLLLEPGVGSTADSPKSAKHASKFFPPSTSVAAHVMSYGHEACAGYVVQLFSQAVPCQLRRGFWGMIEQHTAHEDVLQLCISPDHLLRAKDVKIIQDTHETSKQGAQFSAHHRPTSMSTDQWR